MREAPIDSTEMFTTIDTPKSAASTATLANARRSVTLAAPRLTAAKNTTMTPEDNSSLAATSSQLAKPSGPSPWIVFAAR